MPLPKVGDVIAGKYRIEGSLGEGGMAHVFAAHHTLLDRPVAVKILSPDAAITSFASFVERFLDEARAAAKVDSHHVARIMDVATLDDGLPYMVMERLEGCDLEELLARDGKLRVEDAVDFILQALSGLAHAHARGIVHRDLKPANLFVAKQGDGHPIIKILDFGVAKLIERDRSKSGRLTGEGTAIGTPMYMAPEQIRTPSIIDHRVDIWSLGVVLYELIAGKCPFEAAGVGEIFIAVLEHEVPPLHTVRKDVPEGLSRVVAKALERDPEKRYADAGAFARAIVKFGSGEWSALADIVESTLRGTGRASGSAEVTPTGVPSRRAETPKTETSASIDLSALPRKKHGTSIVRVVLLGAGITGAVAWGAGHHVFDGLVRSTKSRIHEATAPETSASADSGAPAVSASASVAPSVSSAPKPKPTVTASVKRPSTTPKKR